MLAVDIVEDVKNFIYLKSIGRGQGCGLYELFQDVLEMGEEYTAVVFLFEVYLGF